MKRKYYKELTLLIAFMLFLAIDESSAQAVKRQSIASIGTSTINNGLLVQQTAGQSYSTQTFYSSEVGFRPGFIQSVKFGIQNEKTTFNKIDLSVYPNPAIYTVNIESSEEISTAHIQIVSINGQLIYNQKINDLKTKEIDCSRWANGVYLISLIDEENNQKYSSKLLINK